MALNTFACFPRSTPTTALEVMADVMPLHLFCQQEGLLARLRLNEVVEFGWTGTNENKTHCTSHLRHWQNKMVRYKINETTYDKCSRLVWSMDYKINMDSFDGKARHRSLTQYNVYTDGSRKDERTGAGCVVYKGKREVCSESVRLPDYATVFQAEIKAIDRAAALLAGQEDVRYVKIFVDSQAAILALKNSEVRSKTVEDAIGSLNKLARKTRSVQIVWIPAHKGHQGNERADCLAKMGSEQDDSIRMVEIRKPICVVRSEVRNALLEEWTEEWTKQTGVHHARSFYGGPNPRKAKFVIKLARLELGRYVRVITGHNNLNFFQTKIGLANNPGCRLCGLSLIHI